MFKEEDLNEELGITDKRANELVRIVQNIMDREVQNGESDYGRTSHVMLTLAGRKDLNDIEKIACTFIFCYNILNKPKKIFSKKPKILPEIMPEIEIPLGMRGEEFLDVENGISGMLVAPEGVDKSELIYVMMTSLVYLLRDLPKKDSQEICRQASISFAKMALTGKFKL